MDIGIKEVKQYFVTDEPTTELKEVRARRGRFGTANGPYVYLVEANHKELNAKRKKELAKEDISSLNEFIAKKFSPEEQAKLKSPKYFYEIEFEKPGGMIMPIIVELQFEDGTSETHHFPAQIWRKSNQTATRVFATEKPIKKIQLDPKLETADIDVTNNTWPKEAAKSKFDELDKSK